MREIGESSSYTAQEINSDDVKNPNSTAEIHISIEMQKIYTSSITAKLQKSSPRFIFESSNSEQRKIGSIPVVPRNFHKLKQPSAYKPEVISIGPFHHKNQRLKATEHIKLLFAHNLIARLAQPDEEGPAIMLDQLGELVTVTGWFDYYKKCVEEIQNREVEIRQYYSEPVKLKSKEFVEMMVIDGLFVIGLLLRFHNPSAFCVKNSPLHYNRLLRIGVACDLFILENQLPLSVLEGLFNIITTPEFSRDNPFISIAHKYSQDFISKMISPKEATNGTPPEVNLDQYKNATHLLDLLAMLLRPASEQTSDVAKNDPSVYFPSASDLNSAGVKFMKANKHLMDVKFSNGIFEIPRVLIFDSSDQIFRNIIAYEQLYNGGTDMSSYALLMDSLINSAEDVEVLRKAGILSHNLGCDVDVSNMFNKLCFAIDTGGNRYAQIKLDVYGYYKMKKHFWKATLKREYFKNPWTIISFGAAVLLLSLTVLSTTYTILQYYQGEKDSRASPPTAQ